MRLSELAARLHGVDWSNEHSLTAYCPVHENGSGPHKSRSFSVTEQNDGTIVFNCFTDCDREAIRAALGVEWTDLFPPKLRLASNNGSIEPFRRLWREASAADGSLVATYLSSRGVTLPISPSIRFKPDCFYQEGKDQRKLPAMIVPIQIDRAIIGIHRTYLANDGFSKASIPKPKKMLGRSKGGAARFGPTGDRLGIAEGIETALSVMQAEGINCWAALSATGLREVVLQPDVKELIIYPDGDAVGAEAATTLVQRALLQGVRVGVKRPPLGKDFNDLLRDDGENSIRGLPIEWQNPADDKSLPIIDAESGDLRHDLSVVAAAVKKWNNPPRLFVHETTGRLVKLVWRTPKKNDPTSERHATYLTLDEVSVTGYRNILATAARWVKYRKNDVMPTYPRPETVSSAYEDARDGGFVPPLRAIVYAPTCAPSGRFLKPGYDAETHLWYAADDDDPDDGDIDDEDPEVLQAAVSWFEDATHDFIFELPGDRTHALSLFLLPFLREMIDGPIPLYNIEAPIAGTGKGLLSRVLLRPSNSYRMIPETKREDEQEKQITAVCVNSWPAVVIDNVSNVVNSPLLASIVTSKHPELRMMGGYAMVKVRRVPIFVITANNPSFSEENARRVARIRIVSPIEQPSEREGFKHAHLETWIEEVRADLCRAAVTMVRHWLKKGAPRVQGRPWGSFEAWADVMGGVTHFLGYDGFGSARIEREAVDTTESRWRELIDKWGDMYGDQPIKTNGLLAVADAIEGFFTEKEIKGKVRVLAYGLRARKGRIFDQWRLDVSSRAHGVVTWQLKKLE